MRVDLRVLDRSKETPCGWQDMKYPVTNSVLQSVCVTH